MDHSGSTRRRTLLVLHATGAVGADWWIPRLVELADVFVIYREDLLDSFDEIDLLEGCDLAVPVIAGEDVARVTAEALGGRRVDGVLTFSEAMLGQAAAVAERLAVPHHPSGAVRQMQRKDLQRQVCEGVGLPGPRSVSLSEPSAVARAEQLLNFPVIVKPAWGFGSSATACASSRDEFAEVVRCQQANYDSDWRLQGPVGHLVAEELIVGESWHDDPRMGQMVSVESLFFHGEAMHLTVTDKFPPAEPFRETGDIMPSWLSEDQRHEIVGFADSCLRALGAYHGACHTELKLTPDGPRLIEANGRLGGYVAGLMSTVFDYDIVTAIGELALGSRPGLPGPPRCYAAGMNLMSPPTDMMVTALGGIPEIEAMEGVRLVVVGGVGSVPAWRLGGGCYGYIELVGDDPVAMLDLRDAVLGALVYETSEVRR